MEMLVYKKIEDEYELSSWGDRIRYFLRDLSCKYPYFDKWLEYALTEAPSEKRNVIISTVGKKIVGIAILKNTLSEKKICTLRVDTEYRHSGIGYQLLLKSFDILGTDKPLMTINEEHKEEYKKLFHKVNAKYCNKVRSLYNWGVNEYFYNMPYVHKNALFSIKPKYVDEMIAGRKKVEFRKKIYIDPVERIYVYSSSPIKRIVGYIDNPMIQEGFPSSLWNMFQGTAGIDKESFDEYYRACGIGYAICFDKFIQFTEPVNPKEVYSGFVPPQSYCYIDNIPFLDMLRNRGV